MTYMMKLIVLKKLFNFSEKVSNAGKNYMECTTVDATIRERSLKLFADKLIEKVKDNSAYKLTDLKVVLGSFKCYIKLQLLVLM